MAKSPAHKEFARRLTVAVKRKWPGRGAASRLGEALGVTPSHASAYMRGERIPAGAIALKLPKVLGVPADYFRTDALEGPAVERDGGQEPQSGGPAEPAGPKLALSPPTAGGAEHGAPVVVSLATEVVAMLERALARAVAQTLAQDEATATTRARLALADELYEFALRLQRHVGVDATDIFEVAKALRDGRLT